MSALEIIPEPLVNGLSVDIEDWFPVGAFEDIFEGGTWDGHVRNIESNVGRVLEMLDRAEVKATFFTFGSLAKRQPRLMQRIADAGHELASHGWDRVRVYAMDRNQFARNIRTARQAIEDAAGFPVVGYRAPGFSIDNRTPWAYLELADQGYAYSSSIAPIAHRYVGWGEAPRFAFKPLPWTDLVEIPITTAEFGGKRMAAGGGLFRSLPYGLSRWAIRQVNRREYRPAIFFFHLWELDPVLSQAQGRLAGPSPRQVSRLETMPDRLRQLVDDFTWGRIDVVAYREASRLQELAA